MVFAQKIKIQDPWLKNVVLGWNGPDASVRVSDGRTVDGSMVMAAW